MKKFTVQQQVIIWQQFEIEAESEEAAVEMAKEDYTLNNCQPTSNIERQWESETVLQTEIRNVDGDIIFHHLEEETW